MASIREKNIDKRIQKVAMPNALTRCPKSGMGSLWVKLHDNNKQEQWEVEENRHEGASERMKGGWGDRRMEEQMRKKYHDP